MMAVAVLTKDRNRDLGRSPADGDTEASRWRARIDTGKYGRVYCFQNLDYQVHLCRPPFKKSAF